MVKLRARSKVFIIAFVVIDYLIMINPSMPSNDIDISRSIIFSGLEDPLLRSSFFKHPTGGDYLAKELDVTRGRQGQPHHQI